MQTHLKFLFSIYTFKVRITIIHNLHQFTKLYFQNKTIKFLYHRQAVSQSDQNSAVCLYIYTHALFTQFTGETEVALLVTSVALYNACVRLGFRIFENVTIDQLLHTANKSHQDLLIRVFICHESYHIFTSILLYIKNLNLSTFKFPQYSVVHSSCNCIAPMSTNQSTLFQRVTNHNQGKKIGFLCTPTLDLTQPMKTCFNQSWSPTISGRFGAELNENYRAGTRIH